MRNLQFQKAKLKRLIDLEGITITFLRDKLNDFNEPDGSSIEVATIKGLWHTSNSYVTLTKGDAATVRSKPSPEFLTLFEDGKDIKQGDYVMLNGTKFNVNGPVDVGNLQLAINVSLEEVV